MTSDRLTVAICTWNRADLLRVTLDGLTRQELPVGLTWEVLVVDNNSTDHTAAVVREFDGTLPVRYLFEGRQGKSHALNRVLDEAVADWVVFTDDDVLLPPGWLGAYAAATAGAPEAVAFLGGPVEPWFETPIDPALAEAMPAVGGGFCRVVLPADPDIRPGGRVPFGVNCAVHRGRTGGLRFDPRIGPSGAARLPGEEVQFFQALLAAGRLGRWVPDAGLQHYVLPARLRLPSLARMLFDMGRLKVLTQGRPPGIHVAGVPVWAVREAVQSAASIPIHWACGRRVRYYKAVSYACTRAGFVWQCLRSGRRPDGPAVPGHPRTTGVTIR